MLGLPYNHEKLKALLSTSIQLGVLNNGLLEYLIESLGFLCSFKCFDFM